MTFTAAIKDALTFKSKPGLALLVSNVKGMPAVSMALVVLGKCVEVFELGRNSTDGQPVSFRSCLAGKPTPGYGSIFVNWEGPPPTRGQLYNFQVSGAFAR